MTKPINCQAQQVPAYSGITINITNPSMNPGAIPAYNNICAHTNPIHSGTPQFYTVPNESIQNSTELPVSYGIEAQTNNKNVQDNLKLEKVPTKINDKEKLPQAYPQQYYLQNYNYIQNQPNEIATNAKENNQPKSEIIADVIDNNTNLETSKKIIEDIDSKIQEQKELEKTGSKTRVVALTDEYIMSLEKFLNDPNKDMRIMASKDILTRLDEDRDRYDDPALNALLNKMIQDPDSSVRALGLSALSSQLASGNDYTVELLKKIQEDPTSNESDVLEASKSLLKMASSTEVKYIPNPQSQQAETKE